MTTIGKKIDWNTIRNEYIGGGISQRKLAIKHGITYAALRNRAEKDGWIDAREQAQRKATEITAQKIAVAASDNAVVAQRIKAKLLRKLEAEIDKLPESVGSGTINSVIESKPGQKGVRTRKEVSKEYRLKDLAAAYKALTDDMNLNSSSEPVRIVIDV